jgi:hypothetical protein
VSEPLTCFFWRIEFWLTLTYFVRAQRAFKKRMVQTKKSGMMKVLLLGMIKASNRPSNQLKQTIMTYLN